MVKLSRIDFAQQRISQGKHLKPKPKVPRYVLAFDGVDDYVQISLVDIFSQPHALSFWISAGIISSSSMFLAGRQNDVNYYISFNNGLVNDWSTGSSLSWVSNVAYSLGWQHFVFLYDGTNKKIYRNGILQNSIVQSSLPGTGLYLGRYGGYETNMWNGQIGEVRIYNRALSPDEITQLSQGINIRNGLVLHHNYRLGHARDLSGNGNDGTLNGGAKFNIVNYEEV